MENEVGELLNRFSIDEVREIGATMGILSVKKYECKADLIRVIQLAEGREPCFNSDGVCQTRFCMWAGDCLPVHTERTG